MTKRLNSMDPDAQILVITAFGAIESPVETMRAGAFHYLSKPFRTDEILVNVRRALQTRGLKHELRRLQKEVKGFYDLDTIIGHSPQMRTVSELIKQIIDTPANVLYYGGSSEPSWTAGSRG